MGEAQVIQMRRPHRTQVVQPVQAADTTGTRPILCVCQDDRTYWCKNFSENSPELQVNEIVSAEVGKALGAPVRDWAVVDVPDALKGRPVGMGRLGRLPMFGSLELPQASFRYEVSWIKRDGNPRRIPLLVALWYLCNAEDIQLLYDASADHTIWSIDHGCWFGSHEGPRGLFMPSTLAGRTQPPSIGKGTDPAGWDHAREAVEALDASVLLHIAGMIPSEWGVDPSEVHDMTNYVLDRVPYTLEILDEHARRARTEG